MKSRKCDNGCPRVGISKIVRRESKQIEDFLLRHHIDIGMSNFHMRITVFLEFKAQSTDFTVDIPMWPHVHFKTFFATFYTTLFLTKIASVIASIVDLLLRIIFMGDEIMILEFFEG